MIKYLTIRFNNIVILSAKLGSDLTKVRNGFVACGKLHEQELDGRLQTYRDSISDLRFCMNELVRTT